MAHTVQFNSNNALVCVTHTGDLNAEEGLASTAKAIELATMHESYLFLFDMRQAKIDESVANVYTMPDKIWAMGASPKTRVTIVYTADHLIYEFLENVACNRGMTVKRFENMEEAIQWLLEAMI
jgi:hypothetical protein